MEAATTTAWTDEQRRDELDRKIRWYAASGWHVEQRSDTQATLAKGKNHNHLLHLFLTIFTAGLWGIVWICLVVFGKGQQRRMVSIDSAGRALDQKVE